MEEYTEDYIKDHIKDHIKYHSSIYRVVSEYNKNKVEDRIYDEKEKLLLTLISRIRMIYFDSLLKKVIGD